jgi:hypothetical protein
VKLHYIFGLLTLANASFASSIGLFGDPEYTSCNLNLPAPPGVGTLYIVAIDCADIRGACPFFIGAEFRVEGLPAGWVMLSSPSPAAIVAIGDPFGAGANIAFPEYLTSNSVLLYTVTVWPAAAGAEATLQVVSHSTPSDPFLICPVAYVGDCPGPVRACVGGGALFVNQPEPCTVAASQATWSDVKRLYY